MILLRWLWPVVLVFVVLLLIFGGNWGKGKEPRRGRVETVERAKKPRLRVFTPSSIRNFWGRNPPGVQWT